jgi:hypothetical protein
MLGVIRFASRRKHLKTTGNSMFEGFKPTPKRIEPMYLLETNIV